jgi:hypothetical protein
MTFVEIAPLVAGALFIALGIRLSLAESPPLAGRWRYPAALSAAFLLYSAYTVSREGPTGFWVEHTRNLWGVQIWFDLLQAALVGFVLLVPRARAQGLRLVPWLLAVAATGSIGLMAMVARVLYLEARTAPGR